MRITLTLDPDVASKLRCRMREANLTVKEAVNQALRTGLAHEQQKRAETFKVEPHSCRFKAGVDLDKHNQLADDLDAEAVSRKLPQ